MKFFPHRLGSPKLSLRLKLSNEGMISPLESILKCIMKDQPVTPLLNKP